ncbi:MAG: class I SAM-dependent methyltransferase [Planctomycetales bacterium]
MPRRNAAASGSRKILASPVITRPPKQKTTRGADGIARAISRVKDGTLAYVDFLSPLHKKTERDYLARVNEFPKAEAATRAKRFDFDYWDGDRKIGYGGYHYDGRWRAVADGLIDHYQLRPGDKVLDVGCGKGFLLHDLTQGQPGLEITGIDISSYAIEHAKEEARPFLSEGSAAELPYPDDSFDLVISINTLHNLHCYDLDKALREMERVGKKHKYLVVESYRNEEEKANLLYWQLTCESFLTPDEWAWWFERTGYSGDHSFIYFE